MGLPGAVVERGFLGQSWERLFAVALLGSFLAAAVKFSLSNPLLYVALAGPIALLVAAKAFWHDERLVSASAALIWLFDVGFGVTTFIYGSVRI